MDRWDSQPMGPTLPNRRLQPRRERLQLALLQIQWLGDAADKTTGEMPIFERLYQDGFMAINWTGQKTARWKHGDTCDILWCFLLCPSHLYPSQGDKDKTTVVPWRQWDGEVMWSDNGKSLFFIKPPANHASFFHCPVRLVVSDVFWMYSFTFLSHFYHISLISPHVFSEICYQRWWNHLLSHRCVVDFRCFPQVQCSFDEKLQLCRNQGIHTVGCASPQIGWLLRVATGISHWFSTWITLW